MEVPEDRENKALPERKENYHFDEDELSKRVDLCQLDVCSMIHGYEAVHGPELHVSYV